jgi:gas vesicle protein
MVSKGQKPNVTDLRKAVIDIVNIRKSQKAKMKENAPKVLSAQKKLVDNILGKWSKESKSTAEDLEARIKEEGLELN